MSLSELLTAQFAHHDVGEAGAADPSACRRGIAILNGAKGGITIPSEDRAEVYRHLAEHVREAGIEPPPLTSRTEERPVERRAFTTSDLLEFDGTPEAMPIRRDNRCVVAEP